LRCLEAWRELTAEEVRKRDLMGRIVARMQNRSLSFAMELWQQSVSAAQQWEKEEERRQNRFRSVVQRLMFQAQAASLLRWSENVRELVRYRCIIDRILWRMLKAKMSGGMYFFVMSQVCVHVIGSCCGMWLRAVELLQHMSSGTGTWWKTT
jgi:hypothetical protein